MKIKDKCIICKNTFYEEDVIDSKGFVFCPICGSNDIEPETYEVYKKDKDDGEDSDGEILN